MINLTDEQETIIQSLAEYYLKIRTKTAKSEIILLTGGAGRGKSFLIHYIIKHLLAYNETVKSLGIFNQEINIHVTATTKEAVTSLRAANQKDKDTTIKYRDVLREASTIHNLLGIYLQKDYATDSVILRQNNKAKTEGKYLLQNALIVVDEASQMTDEVISILKASTTNCIILAVADMKQCSVIDGTCDWSENPTHKFELNKIMRRNMVVIDGVEQENPISILGEALRESVDTHQFPPIPWHKDYIEEIKSKEDLQKLVAELFTAIPDSTKLPAITTFTNDRKNLYNQAIKQKLTNTTEMTVGDVYVVNTTFAPERMPNFSKYEGPPYDVVPLDQGARIQITKLEQMVVHIWGENLKILVLHFLIASSESGTAFILTPAQKSFLRKELRKANVDYQQDKVKDRNLCTFILSKVIDLTLPYAFTAYKIQGKTLDTVLVDVHDMLKSWDKDRLFRMLHVAVTRAKTKVYLYGSW